MYNGYRGRFAPSPSGEMHLGNAWTAMLAWLQVRVLGGKMILRMEDLDPDRSKGMHANQIIEDLRWLGLDWDEGPDIGGPYAPYVQDKRRHLYETALQQFERAGLLYPCYCSRAELRSVARAPHVGDTYVYPGVCRRLTPDRLREMAGCQASLRLAVPTMTVEFTDLCRGVYRQELARDVGDFIIRRADGVHAYQLAVVVDDAAMKITHVLRGADLLDSTPRQLLLFKLLGLNIPHYSHVSLLVGEDGQRLSKRHGDISIAALRRQGAKAEKIVGYLAYKANLIESWISVKPQELVRDFELAKLSLNNVIVHTSELIKMV